MRDHAGEQGLDVAQHRLDVSLIETHTVVDHLERQRRTGVNHKREWIVDLDVKLNLTDPQLPATLTKRYLDRKILKHEDTLKQRHMTRHLGPSMQLDERCVFILPLFKLLLLQLLQPRQQRR